MQHEPRCIILASGTLSPIEFLEAELRIPFPVKLSNPHIISDHQLFASVLKLGPRSIRLSSSFQNRNDSNYLSSLGDLIRLVCAAVPKGVLVFFPSYSVMDICAKFWQANGTWDKINYEKV